MSADEYNRIRHCCITKTQSCLEAIYKSLLSGTLDPFILDDDGLSGLDYLLMPDEEGHSYGYFLQTSSLYKDLLVESIKLYYEKDPNDPILHRNLQKICTNQLLFHALEERLRRTVGLLLHNYCKPAIPAGDVEVMKGTYAEGEASDSLPLAEEMQYGITRPVSPDRPFVTEEEAELYERQPMPPELAAYRAAEKRSGGLRKKRTKKGGKKGSKKGSKKKTKKGKSKRTKRKTRKSRN
jgi:hypothetical protein